MPKSYQYPKLNIIRKIGDEQFSLGGKLLDATLLDFWRWYASDLVNNAIRGVLAEYIVARALNLPVKCRIEWDICDLVTESGIKIEVKSAAYLQSWNQNQLSKISFDIKPTRKQQEDTNLYEEEQRRQADIYVFCLLHHQIQDTLDPLNLDQWEFYVLPALILNRELPIQKRISLSRLLKLKPVRTDFQNLALAVEQVLNTKDSF